MHRGFVFVRLSVCLSVWTFERRCKWHFTHSRNDWRASRGISSLFFNLPEHEKWHPCCREALALSVMDAVRVRLRGQALGQAVDTALSLIKTWTPNCSRCCLCSVLMGVGDYLRGRAVRCVCEGDSCRAVTVVVPHLHHAAQVAYLLRGLEHASVQRCWQQVSPCSINVNTIWTCILWWNIQISLLLSWQWWRFMHNISFEPT